MTNICFLGIGSNSFGPLSTTSFLVEHDNRILLVDCGPDTFRQISRAGFSLGQIDSLVLTHSHFDHCLGFPYLLTGRHLELLRSGNSPKPSLRVYCEKELEQEMRQLIAFCHPDQGSLCYDIEYESVKGSHAIFQENYDLSFFSTDHTVASVGLCIENSSGWKLCYSGDTLPCPSLQSAAIGSTVLIHEAMIPGSEHEFSRKTKHATTVDAGELAKIVKPQVAFLVHLRPTYLQSLKDLEKEASSIAGLEMSYPEECKTFQL